MHNALTYYQINIPNEHYNNHFTAILQVNPCSHYFQLNMQSSVAATFCC